MARGLLVVLLSLALQGGSAADAEAPPRFAVGHELQVRVNNAIDRGIKFLGGRRLGAERAPPGVISAAAQDCALVGYTVSVHGRAERAARYLDVLLANPHWIADTQTTCLVVLMAAKLGRLSDKVVQRGIKSLAKADGEQGLWGYDPKGKARNLAVTFWVSLALCRAEEPEVTNESLFRLALFLAERQGKDGRWDYSGSGRAPRAYHQGAFMGLGALAGAWDRFRSSGWKVKRQDGRRIAAALGRARKALPGAIDGLLRWLELDPRKRKPDAITWPWHSMLTMHFCCAGQRASWIDKTNWYERTARILVDLQAEQGHWAPLESKSQVESGVRRTCLALLCLKRLDVPRSPITDVTPGAEGK